MNNNQRNNPEGSFVIRNLINQEDRLQNLLKEYNFTGNPSTKKEIDRIFNGLSKAWRRLWLTEKQEALAKA